MAATRGGVKPRLDHQGRWCVVSDSTRIAAVAACFILALSAAALSGCNVIANLGGAGGGGNDASRPESELGKPQIQPDEDGPDLREVRVPDVTGMYYDEAAAALEAAGLTPVEMAVHGPIDEDAGEVGLVYRQTPAAGETVGQGAEIELRYWWESQ